MYQDRSIFVETLTKFIHKCKTDLNNVLDQLEWSKESIYTACQEDKSSVKEVFKEDNQNLKYEGSTSSSCDHKTSIDESESKKTVGSDGLYSEIVASLSQSQSASKQDEKSRAEILAEMLKMERDAKRRRINYKNRVHTKHKSHIEIMREVLAEQMATLTENSGANSASKSSETGDSSKTLGSELTEVHFREGNPYTAWKAVLNQKYISERKDLSSISDRSQEKRRYSDGWKSRGGHEGFDRQKEEFRERDSKYSDQRNFHRHSKSRYHDEEEYTESRSRESKKTDYGRENGRRDNHSRHRSNRESSYEKGRSGKKEEDNSRKREDSEHHHYEKSRKNHKRDRSYSSSPKHKSKKHKSRHKDYY